jgi:hypothetical protein
MHYKEQLSVEVSWLKQQLAEKTDLDRLVMLESDVAHYKERWDEQVSLFKSLLNQQLAGARVEWEEKLTKVRPDTERLMTLESDLARTKDQMEKQEYTVSQQLAAVPTLESYVARAHDRLEMHESTVRHELEDVHADISWLKSKIDIKMTTGSFERAKYDTVASQPVMSKSHTMHNLSTHVPASSSQPGLGRSVTDSRLRAIEPSADAKLAVIAGASLSGQVVRLGGNRLNVDMSAVHAIERRGHLKVDEKSGVVALLQSLDFVPKTQNMEPRAEFKDPITADAICGDLADLSKLFHCPMTIEGHTKGGTDQFWQKLASERARVVAEKVIKFGADASLVKTRGLPGELGMNEVKTHVYMDIDGPLGHGCQSIEEDAVWG